MKKKLSIIIATILTLGLGLTGCASKTTQQVQQLLKRLH